MRRYANLAIEVASIVALPCVLLTCALSGFRSSALLIFCAAVLSLAMFFASWETSRPAIRQIMPVAVLSALAAAGRIVFAAAPSIQPVTAICVISGAAFGRRPGFMTGSIAAFVSNCFLGQGMWTPWQMYAWGLVGYLAGIFFSRKYATGLSGSDIEDSEAIRRSKVRACVSVCIFGFLASYLFSFIMNTWTVVGFGRDFSATSVFAIYAAGAVFDTIHAISTVVFLAALYPAWHRKLVRIKTRYGLSPSKIQAFSTSD